MVQDTIQPDLKSEDCKLVIDERISASDIFEKKDLE